MTPIEHETCQCAMRSPSLSLSLSLAFSLSETYLVIVVKRSWISNHSVVSERRSTTAESLPHFQRIALVVRISLAEMRMLCEVYMKHDWFVVRVYVGLTQHTHTHENTMQSNTPHANARAALAALGVRIGLLYSECGHTHM